MTKPQEVAEDRQRLIKRIFSLAQLDRGLAEIASARVQAMGIDELNAVLADLESIESQVGVSVKASVHRSAAREVRRIATSGALDLHPILKEDTAAKSVAAVEMSAGISRKKATNIAKAIELYVGRYCSSGASLKLGEFEFIKRDDQDFERHYTMLREKRMLKRYYHTRELTELVVRDLKATVVGHKAPRRGRNQYLLVTLVRKASGLDTKASKMALNAAAEVVFKKSSGEPVHFGGVVLESRKGLQN